MRLRWLRAARADVRRIGRTISQDSPEAAERVTARIVQTVDLLRDHPGLGRAGRVLGTRELVIAGMPYIAAYRVHEERVEIVAVVHATQRWPENFSDRLDRP